MEIFFWLIKLIEDLCWTTIVGCIYAPEGLWVLLILNCSRKDMKRRLFYKLLSGVQHYTLDVCYLVYKLQVKLINGLHYGDWKLTSSVVFNTEEREGL